MSEPMAPTSSEDSFGVAYRGGILKFAETALFRYSFAPSGKHVKGAKIGKADLRFTKGDLRWQVLQDE